MQMLKNLLSHYARISKGEAFIYVCTVKHGVTSSSSSFGILLHGHLNYIREMALIRGTISLLA